MSKSIMVEVDETTKSILEMLEDKMASGVDSKLQAYKSENDFALQSLYSQFQLQLQDMSKSITKDNERAQRNLDELLHDLEDQLEDIKDQLNDARKEQASALQGFMDSLSLVRNELKENFEFYKVERSKESKKQMEIIKTAVKEIGEFVENSIYQLQEKINKQEESLNHLATKESMTSLVDKKSLAEVSEKLTEEFSSKLDELESKFDVRQDVQLLVNKLEKMEKDLAWANQPFYKKWFGKRG
jgi:hypothetical protein